MKKKKTLLVLVVLLLLLGVGSFTYARYVTNYSGTGKAEIAKWAVALKNGNTALSETFELDLELEESTTVADGKIAPGRGASAKFQLDLTGTEVTADTNFSVNTNNLPAGISVTSAKLTRGATEQELTITNGAVYGSMIIPYDATDKIVDVVIELEWNMTGSDTTDTELGKTAGTLEIPLGVKVQQAE